MSEIKVNSIKGVAASTAALTINNTDGTCTANITNRSNKNLVINGSCIVAQRSQSVSATSGGYTTVDRFQQSVSNIANGVDIAQASISSGGAYDAGFRKSYKVTNGDNNADSNDQSKIHYKIESQDLASSGWDSVNSNSKVTFSFWVKSSVAQTFVVHLDADDSDKVYAFEYSATTSWTKITHTIPGASGLTFNNDNGVGLNIQWFLYMGTDKTDNSFTYNAWGASSGSSRSRDMTTTWQTTDDATFEITGIQLEVGSLATDFEHLSFADYLRKCQRYYFRFTTSVSGTFVAMGHQMTSSAAKIILPFPMSMRVRPTAVETTGTATDYSVARTSTYEVCDVVPTFAGASKEVANVNTNQTQASLSTTLPVALRANSTSFYLGFSAEL